MESAQQSLPTQINGYSLDTVIQQTAYSTSYLSLDEASKEKVLVIIYNTPANDTAIEQAKSLAAAPCDAILPIYDVGSADGFLYISCQYLEGNTLEKLINEEMTIADAQAILEKLAKILNELHQANIYHGNLNPNCIHLDSAGKVYLSHFKIQNSKVALQAIGEQTDNASFSAPETFRGDAPSQASDIYSLGLLAYSAITGTVAYQADSNYETALLQQQAKLPLIDGISNSLQSFIQQACKKNPAFRPTDLSVLNSTHSATEHSVSNNSLSVDANDRRSNIAPAKNTPAQTSSSKTPIIIASASMALLGFSAAVYVSPQHDGLAFLLPIHDAIANTLDSKQAEINQLLANGQSLIDQQQYLDAAKIYHQVLSIKADEPTALEKLNELVHFYLNQAFASLDDDNFSEADIQINHALDIDDKHAAIPPVQALYNEKLQAKIDAENNAAAQQLADKNAAAESSRLAKLNADKAAALAEQQRIAAEKAESERKASALAKANAEAAALAKSKADAAALAKAKAVAEAAEKLAEEERIRKAQIAAALAKAAAMQAELEKKNNILGKVKITGLLKKADTYYNRGNYHTPAKENALEKYQAVLALDADNGAAIVGLDKTVTAIIPTLVQLFENDQFSQGKLLFNQLKAASPNNEKLNIFAGAQGL